MVFDTCVLPKAYIKIQENPTNIYHHLDYVFPRAYLVLCDNFLRTMLVVIPQIEFLHLE